MCMRFVVLTYVKRAFFVNRKQASRRCTRVHSSTSHKLVSMRIVILTYVLYTHFFPVGTNSGCLTRFARSPIIAKKLYAAVFLSYLWYDPVSMYTRKMVPITGRASSFLDNILLVWSLIERKRRRGRQYKNYRAINLPIVI